MEKRDDPPPYGLQPPPYQPQGPPPPHVGGFANVGPPQGPVTVTTVLRFGPEAQRILCPYCNTDIRTDIRAEPTTKTHLFAILLCLLCWPCTCVPYCMDSCQNRNHYCPACKEYLGTYNEV